MRPYVIRQGDYLRKLAWRFGFDADEVWRDPKNADLRSERKAPEMLCPGDLLFIPEASERQLTLNAGQINTFVATPPTVHLELAFLNEDGKQIADTSCTVIVLGEEQPNKTNNKGVLVLDVRIDTPFVKVVFESLELAYVVALGHLDPQNVASGDRQRLANLGYYPLGCNVNLPSEGRDARAIAAFQRDVGLDVTGSMDDESRKRLMSAHGL